MTRSLVAHSLRFNRKRHPDEAIAPSDLDGDHLFKLLRNFFDRCTYQETRNERNRTMIEKQSFKLLEGSESCLLYLNAAKWGEESQVLNPDNYDDIRYHISPIDPVSTDTRAYCHVPSNGERAFFLSEYVDRVSGGVGFLNLFKSDFVHSVPRITCNLSRVYGSEEWLKTAELAEVQIKVLKKHQIGPIMSVHIAEH